MNTAVSTYLRPSQPTVAEVRSPVWLAWRRFRRHKFALLGLFILFGLLLFVLFGGFIFAHGLCTGTGGYMTGEAYANCNDTSQLLHPPSSAHPFGTDTVGRDILARIIYGGQISIMIGLFAALTSVTVGTLVGVVAGYYRGWIDSLLMRFTEAMLSIPSLFLLLVMAKFLSGQIADLNFMGRTFSGSVIVIIAVIGLTSWMGLARVVRATTLSLKERDFVKAAYALGVPHMRIILQHILPNTTAPIIVTATLEVASAILSEAYISFLGMGVQPPTASWGNMLERAYRYVETAPWLWIFPGTFILLTVLSVNFVGDGLRDALDPRH